MVEVGAGDDDWAQSAMSALMKLHCSITSLGEGRLWAESEVLVAPPPLDREWRFGAPRPAGTKSTPITIERNP